MERALCRADSSGRCCSFRQVAADGLPEVLAAVADEAAADFQAAGDVLAAAGHRAHGNAANTRTNNSLEGTGQHNITHLMRILRDSA